MITMNELVAIAPIQFKAEDPSTSNSRFARHDRAMNEIVATVAVFDGPNGIKAGDTLYFRAEIAAFPAYKTTHNLNGKEFKLISVNTIVGLQKS